jgi:hypothetical protein
MKQNKLKRLLAIIRKAMEDSKILSIANEK